MSDIALPPQASVSSRCSSVGDFVALLKPKVMSLVVFSGFAGYWLAPGREDLNPILAAIGMFALALGAGAAGAFNMWFDRDIDAVMKRTRTRPLPAGRIAPDDALGFAILASIFACTLMAIATNFVAAFYLALANMFYVLVYTVWLKRRTPQNIVIGGAAGAFPPVIGWAMVTGDASLAPWLLFALIFFWTPPHFWALALFANDDYRAARVPMLPVIRGERHTKWQMLAYTLLLLPLSLAPTLIGVTGWAYGAFSILLNLVFIYAAIATLREEDGSHRAARKMFGYSVLYLFALFLSMMMDKV